MSVIFKEHRLLVTTLTDLAKTSYYTDLISNCETQGQLFKAVEKLLHQKGKGKLPSHSGQSELAERFAQFFDTKIRDIHKSFPSDVDDTAKVHSGSLELPCLETLVPTCGSEVLKVINASPLKTCNLDPVPSCLLAKHLDILLPTICDMINTSLKTGVFPESFKHAVVTPILKKPSLDCEELKNYRPISNLQFISKILEKIVAIRLTDFLTCNSLYEPLQSAYRKFHGTETALMCVHTDIMQALDNKLAVYLVLLDLSSAFDTIDHDILIHRLESLGFRGSALAWFVSYLTGRTQAVNINGSTSTQVPLLSGVPQGSVLGPVLFSIYASPIADIARQHGVMIHMYADDTQLYLPFNPSVDNAEDVARTKLECCISDIRMWMTSMKLKLNETKTELLIISSKKKQSKIHRSTIMVGNSCIQSSPSVRNLGTTFDSTMTMETQIKNTCQSMYYHIRNVGKIRRYLTDEAAHTVVHALVTSRLDYGNCMVFGITSHLLDKLQRAQNAAARMLTRTRKFDHISPVLRNLHWLPIRQRIKYKLLLLTWKALHGMAPPYIQDLLKEYAPTRNLRSSSQHLLDSARTSTSYGDRAFSAVAPALWNALPTDIRESQSIDTFCSKLKTHLFSSAFN